MPQLKNTYLQKNFLSLLYLSSLIGITFTPMIIYLLIIIGGSLLTTTVLNISALHIINYSCIISLLFLLQALFLFTKTKIHQLLIPIIFGTLFTLLFAFYGLNVGSNSFFASNTTHKMLVNNSGEIFELLNFFTDNTFFKIVLIALFIFLFFLIWKLFFYIGKEICVVMNKISENNNGIGLIFLSIFSYLPILFIQSFLTRFPWLLKNRLNVEPTTAIELSLSFVGIGILSTFFFARKNTQKSIKSTKPKLLFAGISLIIMSMSTLYLSKTQVETKEFIGIWGWGLDPFLSYNSEEILFLNEHAKHRAQKELSELDELKKFKTEINSEVEKPNVFVILVDALRADHMSTYNYNRKTTPFLDSLYKEGSLFKIDKGVSTCSDSVCGILSLLSSKSWKNLTRSNFFVHDYLKELGYKINFVVSGVHKGFGGLYEAYNSNIDYYFGEVDKEFGLTDDRRLLKGLENLDGNDGTPDFSYIHLMSTHSAGKILPNYTKNAFKNGKGITDAEQIVINTYDSRVAQADMIISEIFTMLEEKNYLSNSIIIITADHGEDIKSCVGKKVHGCMGHGRTLGYGETNIPILIYDKRGIPIKNQEFGTLVDIGPTIIKMIDNNLPIPPFWEGRSLTSNPIEAITYHEVHHRPDQWKGLVWRTDEAIFKYIVNKPQSLEMLYDISKDPLEANNLIQEIDTDTKEFLQQKFNENWPE